MYLDDTGYEKLVIHKKKVLMFAGFGKVIQQWKDWIFSDPIDASGMPPHKGMAVCMVDAETQNVDFHAHQDIVSDGVHCAGSGARPAYGCWLLNKCAKTAVETAKKQDFCSGGEVKYFDFRSGENNASNPFAAQMTIDEVDKAINQRGVVMKINVPGLGNPPFAFANGANDDESEAAVKEIRSKIASGELSANAPCDGMYNDWSEENKIKFNKALAGMFGWKS